MVHSHKAEQQQAEYLRQRYLEHSRMGSQTSTTSERLAQDLLLSAIQQQVI